VYIFFGSNLISIITINKNNASGLRKTLESVVGQNSVVYESIVIDGGSDDESVNIVKEYQKHIKYWVSEPDTGIYHAMNKGIRCSSGDYLLFLNSGDWLSDSNVLTKVFHELYDADVISGDIDIYDKGQWHFMKSEEKITVNYFFRLSLYHQVTFIAKSLFLKYGMYREDLKYAGDFEFFIRTLLKNNGSYRHVPIKIANYIADGVSNNPSCKSEILKEWNKAWQFNFNDRIFNELKEYIQLDNSEVLEWGRRINKFMPF
jgi:glycosyltransferase involved in cell wall biosynthesis